MLSIWKKIEKSKILTVRRNREKINVMKKIYKFIKKYINALINSINKEDCSLLSIKGVVVLYKSCERERFVGLIFALLLTIYAFVNNIDISDFKKIETWENIRLDIPSIMFGSHNLFFLLILVVAVAFIYEMVFPYVFYKVYLIDENALYDICKKYYVKKVNGKVITLRYKERVFFKFIKNDFIDFDDFTLE